ncbi:hypothetical protein [Granulicella sp. 5B5]|uniref:hypothetical protein n=1 Tax=Granulicella sp. 5B5 TaxID=1617967 RepID=UPI002107F91C|nr:hypothetical protein [Granulicella sp. 5B5]
MAAAAIVGVPSAHAQTQSNPCKTTVRHHKAKKDEMPCEDLRKQLADQQAQIDALKQQLADMPKAQPESDPIATPLAQKAQQTADTAQQTANNASAAASTADAKATDADAKAVSADKKVDALHDEVYSPSALHYKGITITPIAFAAAEGVWRQHTVNSDINTPFNNIPLPSASEGHTSELNFSGRQSRLGVLFQSQATPTAKLTGYYEMDFLGTGTSSNNNQSNSYVMRQRQIWGQVALQNGFTMTGGQMWSLIAENRKGTDARTSIQPNSIDSQYLAGYSWTRQPGFRIQQRFGDESTKALTLAVSVEQSQITGFTVASTVSAAIPVNYYFGGIGQNGGLYNAAAANGGTSNITTYANNVAPDVIVKAAVDLPNFHGEVGGLGRFLRDYYLPITASGGTAAAPTYTYASTYSNHTSAAGGVFGSARVYLADKKIEVAAQAMVGQGVGRYGSSQLADATLRPDETIEPIRNYHGLFSLETHPTKKFDVFGYYGGEYAQRTVYTTSQGDLIGYGPGNLVDSGCYNLPAAPSTTVGAGNGGGLGAGSSCNSPTRYIQEAMAGVIWKPIVSPKYGRLQYWVTYSYLQRNLWSGNNVPATGPITSPTGARATEPMVHVSMRYYIP